MTPLIHIHSLKMKETDLMKVLKKIVPHNEQIFQSNVNHCLTYAIIFVINGTIIFEDIGGLGRDKVRR